MRTIVSLCSREGGGLVRSTLLCGEKGRRQERRRRGGVLVEYQVDDLPPNSLRCDDLKAWNCNRAAQLLQEASSETTWVYLDGSAGQRGFGSAATIYKPNGTILVLCLPSPYHSSEGSEYWAGIMFLRWVSSLNQPMQCIILGENEQVIHTANVQ